MKPSKVLKSSPPQSITTPGELPFQEGRPLPPSDDKDEDQVVRSAKRFAPNREVFMIHAGENCEGLELVQLGDYDDYLLDDIQKERHRLINAKRAKRRHRTIETNQQGSGNLYDSSIGDLCTIINASPDTRNVIIAR
jgi:hypothetical protein